MAAEVYDAIKAMILQDTALTYYREPVIVKWDEAVARRLSDRPQLMPGVLVPGSRCYEWNIEAFPYEYSIPFEGPNSRLNGLEAYFGYNQYYTYNKCRTNNFKIILKYGEIERQTKKQRDRAFEKDKKKIQKWVDRYNRAVEKENRRLQNRAYMKQQEL